MTHHVFAGIAIALALCASIAAASDYSDFRIPSHSTSRLDLSLAGRFSPYRDNRGPTQVESKFGQANASGSWAFGYDSERLQYAFLIAGGATGDLRHDQSSTAYPFPFSSLEERDREGRSVGEFWSLQASVQNYPTTHAWALGAGVSGNGWYDQRWSSRVDVTATPPDRTRSATDSEDWTYQYLADAFVFTGWGRVRDATGIQQVQFIEDRLMRDGVLDGPLRQRTLQRLAELFYLQSGFQRVHDQPDRFFWSEFERILREDPALRADMFNAYALMHASDRVVVSAPLDRQVGAFFGPIVTFRHTNGTRRSNQSFLTQAFSNDILVSETSGAGSSHFEQDDQRALGGLQANVERPLSTHWHLSLFALGQSDLRGPDWYAELRTGMSLRYWGGERWYLDAKVDQFRATGDDNSSYLTGWSVQYGTSVSYYLEDHLSIRAAVSESQEKLQYRYEPGYRRAGLVSLGLSYRRGTLTAPGLVGKVRPVGS